MNRSDPSTSTPRPTLRKALQIGGGANTPLPMTLSWTGSRERKASRTLNYQFIQDRSVQTLDRDYFYEQPANPKGYE